MSKRKAEEQGGGDAKKVERAPNAKYWLFTWHGGIGDLGFDYNSPVWVQVTRYFSMHATHVHMQEEVCPSTGRHHMQGFVGFDKRKRFPEIKELQPISYPKVTKASEKSNKLYCGKTPSAKPGGLFWSKGFPNHNFLLSYEELYDWQQEIWNLVKDECTDDRTIHWYCDEKGNAGKTRLIKNLIFHMNAFLFEGKTSDIANRVVDMRTAPNICLMNLRRSNESHVNYNAIEALKDGLLATGKYAGGQKIFNSPHVIVFSNFAPDLEKLSADRWNVKYYYDGKFN